MGGDPLTADLPGGGEGQQPQVFQLVQEVLLCGGDTSRASVDQVALGDRGLAAAALPVVRRSRFWRHWGTKTVMFLWPRLQNVSTASAIPRQEKKR